MVGGCKLQLVAYDKIVSFPPVQGGVISNVIPLIGAWETILPTVYTQEYQESWGYDNGARVCQVSLVCNIPKDRALLLQSLWDLSTTRFVGLNYDRNGTVKVIGTKAEPAQVRITALTHGAKAGDRNTYQLQVTCTRSEQSPFYLGSLPPSGTPGACAPVSLYDANGNYMGIIPSGAVYQLPACPSPLDAFPEYIASLTASQIIALLTTEQLLALNALLNTDIDVIDGGWPDSTYGNTVDPDDVPPPDPEDYEADDYESDDYYD